MTPENHSLSSVFHHKIRLFIFPALLVTILMCYCNIASGQLYINELLASNTNSNIDQDFGEFSDWIEIYNAGSQSVDLGGYYLTNNLQNPTKWRIPDSTILETKGFKLFWADGMDKRPGDSIVQYKHPLSPRSRGVIRITNLHLNFTLKKRGAIIAILDPQSEIIDSLSYKDQISDISFGRSPNSNQRLGFLTQPTPGETNDDSFLDIELSLTPVQFSISRGFYKKAQTLSLSHQSEDVDIYYSVDGSSPTRNSIRYVDGIEIGTTKVIRAAAYKKGIIPSVVSTHTYFIKEQFTLPVLSISIEPDYLWDDKIGIYVEGDNGIADLLGSVANYNQNWERPAQIEYFNESGEKAFSTAVGIKIVGILHQTMPQKSIAVYLRQKYGSKEFNHQIFPSKEIKNFKTLVLRNSGADVRHTLFRDGMMNCLLIGKINIDYQAYRPVIVFYNGKYWGIHNLREKLNEHYPSSNYGLDPKKIDMIENFKRPVLVNGDSTHYYSLINFIESNDISIESNYRYLQTLIDVDEFIDYNIAEIYFANRDWPANNTKLWRLHVDGGKWRWIIVDLDAGFGLVDSYKSNSLRRVTDPNGEGWCKPWSTLLLRKLLTNTKFRDVFTDRFAHHIITTFEPKRVIKIIDSLQTNLEPEMQRHINRWGTITSMKKWHSKIDVMYEFARKRPAYMRQFVMDHFSLSESSEFAILTAEHTLSTTEKAALSINPKNTDRPKVNNAIVKGQLIDISTPDPTNNITFAIGKLVENKEAIQVSGWAILDGFSSENTRIFIVLKSLGSELVYSTSKVTRVGVTKHFNTLNYDDSGFQTLISKENLKPGAYKVGIYIVKDKYSPALEFTKYTINVPD